MRLPLLTGFFSELSAIAETEKLAFGEQEAMRVAGLAKKLQFPKAVSRISGMPLGGLRPKKTLIADYKGTTKALVGPVHPRFQATFNHNLDSDTRAFVEQQGGNLVGHSPRIIQGPSFMRGIRRLSAQSKSPFVPEPVRDPAQNRVLQGIFKGHELDEAKGRLRAGAKQFGHNSPDVILREHNRVTTLPPEFEPARRYMRDLRLGREADLMPKGIPYGRGPRLSRHARRRLTDMIADRANAQAREYARPLLLQQFGVPDHPIPG